MYKKSRNATILNCEIISCNAKVSSLVIVEACVFYLRCIIHSLRLEYSRRFQNATSNSVKASEHTIQDFL